MQRKKALSLCVIIVLTFACFTFLAKFIPQVQATTHVVNQCQFSGGIASLIAAGNLPTILAGIKNDDVNEVFIEVGGWNHDGTIGQTDTEVNQQTFIADCHTAGLTALFGIYNGFGDYTYPDCSSSTTRTNMKNAVSTILAYGWDGFENDMENVTGTNTAADVAAAWNGISVTCQNAGKIGAVYYGMNYPYSFPQESQLLPLLVNQNFIVTRFCPIDSANVTMYNEILNYMPSNVTWMPQIRDALEGSLSDSGVLETPESSIVFYTAEFGGTIPPSYRGAAVWSYPNITPTEWGELTSWNVWSNGQTGNQSPTFGVTSTPLSDLVFNTATSRMRGSIASPYINGAVSEISAYLRGNTSVTVNATCALYYVSNNGLVAQTNQVAVSLSTSYQLFNFTFSSPPSVLSGTQYYLEIWVNNTSGGNVYLGSSTASPGTGNNADYYSDSYTYGSSHTFPSTASLTQANFGPDCIYATLNTPTYTITVTSTYGLPTPTGIVTQGDNYVTDVISPSAGTTGTQYVCTGYSIDGGGLTAGSSYTFTNVQTNHTITYSWQTQYYLTVTSSYGTPNGQGWYNAMATANFNVTGSGYNFASWVGVGSGSYSGTALVASVTMNNPINETATWTGSTGQSGNNYIPPTTTPAFVIQPSPPISATTSMYTDLFWVVLAVIVLAVLLLIVTSPKK